MKFYLLIFFCMVTIPGCRKQLQQSVASNISTIDDLEDCERLLNNIELFGKQPAATEISSDNYYYKDSSLEQLPALDRRLYLWETDLYMDEVGIPDYNYPYIQINRVNEILHALHEIHIAPMEAGRKDNIEGMCLFYRSYAFYNLLQLYARPYNAASAQTDTGIALVLTWEKDAADYRRSSMKESYERVIEDLLRAAHLLSLLPDSVKRHKPSKVAAWSMLARTHLSMRNYNAAKQYADSSLKYYPHLLDYNDAVNIKPFPFGTSNSEVIYQAYLHDDSKLLKGRTGAETIIDSVLYSYYDSNDLRKTLYYKSSGKKLTLNGSYTGSIFCFAGLAADELYLVRAECAARNNNLAEAMATLNDLLIRRYKNGTFRPQHTDLKDSALCWIYKERRKELAFRGLRWTDLRRLNKESPHQTIRRLVGGVMHELPPNDLRYTFPIPVDALAGSHMVQNPRE